MFLPIPMLPQRGGFQSVVLHAFAPFLPFLRLHHIILDARFLEPAVQIESEGARFITGPASPLGWEPVNQGSMFIFFER
jgi:hypothetical protein